MKEGKMDKEEIKLYQTDRKAKILNKFDEMFGDYITTNHDTGVSRVASIKPSVCMKEIRKFVSDAIDKAAKNERKRVCEEIIAMITEEGQMQSRYFEEFITPINKIRGE